MNRKLRKILAGGLAVVLLFAVSGCGAGKSESVAENAETKQETVVLETEDSSGALTEEAEETEAEETEAEERAQTGVSSYDEILQHFYTIISDPYEDYGDAPGEMGVLESARGIEDNALDAIGYVIEDLSGDGIPELVIGTFPEYGGMVNAVYTLVDGTPRFVFEGWYRNMYSYMGSGTFFHYASNSAMESGQGTFALTRDGTALECQSFLFTHPDENGSGDLRVYYNTTGSWDPAESEDADMSLEDYWALDPAGGVLPLTPFSGFGSDRPAVSVRWLEEAGALMDYDECSVASGEEGTSCIVFIPERPVKQFTILSLTVVDVNESGSIEFEAYPEMSGPKDSWLERPLVTEVAFTGDLPQYGFQYEDENGDVRRFALVISGRDGSILMQEADRDYFGFVITEGMQGDV